MTLEKDADGVMCHMPCLMSRNISYFYIVSRRVFPRWTDSLRMKNKAVKRVPVRKVRTKGVKETNAMLPIARRRQYYCPVPGGMR